MTEIAKPPVEPRPAAVSPGDVDGLLYAFYRAETPAPWPPLELPAASSPRPALPAQRRGGLAHSRLALAAAVLFLLGGSLALSGTFRDSSSRPGPSFYNNDMEIGSRKGLKLPSRLGEPGVRKPASDEGAWLDPENSRSRTPRSPR
jgi:hypothetical protein